ncbi:MAG: hypothetical protein WAS27_01845 [Candidatus Saccharimonadales bacterium]
MNEDFMVEAEVHKAVGEGYRVKALILGIGQYINGMMVYPPNSKHDEWVIYTPTVGKSRIVEFRGEAPIWKQIRDACIVAVKAHINEGGMQQKSYRSRDVVIQDIPDGPVDLSGIPDNF